MADQEKIWPSGYDQKTAPIGADAILIYDSVTGIIKWSTITHLMTNAGAGQNGQDGISLSHQGTYTSEAALIASKGAIQANWTYYNSVDRKFYVRNLTNTAWGIGAQDGAAGSNAISPNWQGEYATEAALIAAKGAVQANWIYKNTTDKKSYIRDLANATWGILSVDGQDALTTQVGAEVRIFIQFPNTNPETIKMADYCKLLTQSNEGGIVATVVPPLNTNLAPFTPVTVTPSAAGLVRIYGVIISPFADTTPPVVTAFTIPASYNSLIVPINTFTATDNVAVTGYLVTDTGSTPSLSNLAWSANPWTQYTFSQAGTYTLYAWARDAAGNISASASASVAVTNPNVDYLEVEFTSGADMADFAGANVNLPATWNTVFGVTGGQAFTSVSIINNVLLRLSGGSKAIDIPIGFSYQKSVIKAIRDYGQYIHGILAVGFRYNTVLHTLHLPAVSHIDEYAFAQCTALDYIACASATILGNYAFSGVSKAQMFYFQNALSVGAGCFRDTLAALEIHLEGLQNVNTALGGTNSFNDVFVGTNPTSNVNIFLPQYFATNNGGGPDGDIVQLETFNAGHYTLTYTA
jgi:hypothetical protein